MNISIHEKDGDTEEVMIKGEEVGGVGDEGEEKGRELKEKEEGNIENE